MNNRLIALAAMAFLALSCGQDKGAVRELKSEADLSGLTISTDAGSYYDHKAFVNRIQKLVYEIEDDQFDFLQSPPHAASA